MKIERKIIKVADLINAYSEKGSDGIEGITAYGGQLDVRPPYQRGLWGSMAPHCTVPLYHYLNKMTRQYPIISS